MFVAVIATCYNFQTDLVALLSPFCFDERRGAADLVARVALLPGRRLRWEMLP